MINLEQFVAEMQKDNDGLRARINILEEQHTWLLEQFRIGFPSTVPPWIKTVPNNFDPDARVTIRGNTFQSHNIPK